MAVNSTAPSGGSEGGGFDTENIGSGEHDLKSLTHLPLDEVIRRVTTGELTIRAGYCAGCGRKHPKNEQSVLSGMWVWPLLDAVVFHSLCGECVPRMHNPEFRERIRDEAYRSLFKAGPDDVGGAA
jgi:hypothetical protein